MARWFLRHVICSIQSWRSNDSHIFFVLDLSTLLTNYLFTFYGFFNIMFLIARECSLYALYLKGRRVLWSSCSKPVLSHASSCVDDHMTLPAPTSIQWMGKKKSDMFEGNVLNKETWLKTRRKSGFFQQWGFRHIFFLFVLGSLNLDRGIC